MSFTPSAGRALALIVSLALGAGTAIAAPVLRPAAARSPGPAAAASGTAPGLPAVASGPRPGPDILYASPPVAPQLQNTGPWTAPPILVSGAQAYRGGEYLYQDYLFDDHGATGTPDDTSPYGASSHLYAPVGGTFTYPTDPRYAHNAADLVEMRIKPLSGLTLFRVTLNTLADPTRVAFTVALGSGATAAWPHAAGVASAARDFLTWHGTTAELVDASTGRALSPAPRVHLDLYRRQVTVAVPASAWDPGRATVHTIIGVGLWDPSSGNYLAPKPGEATATTPGGGTPQGVAIVNVGPRLAEPLPVTLGATMADTAAAGTVTAPWWRERQQSEQLTRGDLTPLGADVDFAKLRGGGHDESGVPTAGPMDRIFASHFSYGQGLEPARVCYDLASQFASGAKCVGRFVGQLQPYALYVPHKPAPRSGYGMTLLLHSLSTNYNQYLADHNQAQLGERGDGSVVLTPEGRGPDGFYAGVPEADTFEAWADVTRHYPLDPGWAAVSGYSMGGFGTYRLAARWPDLFGRAFSVVGAPGSVNDQLASLRNVPLLLWNSAADELVNLQTSENAVSALTAANVRFRENLHLTADHLTLAGNDQFQPGADFLGSARVDRDPFHVTYVVDPTEDAHRPGTVADHAYWLSGLRPRGAGDATVDAVSRAFGEGDPAVLPIAAGAGALTGGELPALAYVSRERSWGPAPAAPAHDVLDLQATNLATVTVDVTRARLDCRVQVRVHSDGPVSVFLAGCGRVVRATR